MRLQIPLNLKLQHCLKRFSMFEMLGTTATESLLISLFDHLGVWDLSFTDEQYGAFLALQCVLIICVAMSFHT